MQLNGGKDNTDQLMPLGPLRLLKIKSNRIFEAYMRSKLLLENISHPQVENENTNENDTYSPSSNKKKRAYPISSSSSSSSSRNGRSVKNDEDMRTIDISSSSSSRIEFEDLSIDTHEDNPLLQTRIDGKERNTSAILPSFFHFKFHFSRTYDLFIFFPSNSCLYRSDMFHVQYFHSIFIKCFSRNSVALISYFSFLFFIYEQNPVFVAAEFELRDKGDDEVLADSEDEVEVVEGSE